MKQNYKIYLCALLLFGATSMMTAGAQGSGKPTLAVFVVGMQTDALCNDLAQQIGAELNSDSRYNVLSSATDPVKTKLAELRKQDASGIDRNALAEWGSKNGVSTICLVVDDIKGNDHMFYARLIDAKDSKVNGRGSYIRTGVSTSELPRVSSALARQLEGPARRPSAPAPTRSYPAELDIEMVFVEGGTFTMGCTPEQTSDCSTTADVEYPHNVTVNNFHIGKYVITRAQWNAVIPANHPLASRGNYRYDDQLPIEMVSWHDIDTAFLPRLNRITGKSYRLPTEAEWEYAARGGKKSQGYKFSGSSNLTEVGWVDYNSGNMTHLVGQKKPNELEIYDMSGNLWEWCRDWYNISYYKTSPTNNPVNTTESTNGRVRRGGRAGSVEMYCRVAARNYNLPSDYFYYIGFRVVLPAQ
jgi:formylglycine-generating enzyme required for sulfatase activity